MRNRRLNTKREKMTEIDKKTEKTNVSRETLMKKEWKLLKRDGFNAKNNKKGSIRWQ